MGGPLPRHQPAGGVYEDSVHRYLAFLAVACLIASLHAGPVMILVWATVALVLLGGHAFSPFRGGRGPTECSRHKPRGRC